MKKLAAALFTIATLCALGACNTIAGVGKDVQKVGQAVEGVGKK